MSENDNNGRKPLTLKPRTGGSVSSGTVKQSFSHGRTKTVVVETKRARPHAAAGGNLAAPSAAERRVFLHLGQHDIRQNPAGPGLRPLDHGRGGLVAGRLDAEHKHRCSHPARMFPAEKAAFRAFARSL